MGEYLYELKPSLITRTERAYFTAIGQSLPADYFVQPQVNLASIITKNGNHRYQSELYRNIDFCVFDVSYKPIVLIEINDSTHTERNRRERDEKVKNICEDAGIQLITFWTNYGVNQDYIYKRVNDAIQNAPYYQRKAHFCENGDNENYLSDERIDEIINNAQAVSDYNYPQADYEDNYYEKPRKISAWRYFVEGVKFRTKLLFIRIAVTIALIIFMFAALKACTAFYT